MSDSTVRTELDRMVHVAVVSFARGQRNHLDADLLDEIADHVERASAQGARAAVLRSDARHFSAGVDVLGARVPGARHLYDAVPRLFALPVPVVASIDGAAVGGGLGLALACDFRVAGPRARLAANFARLGFSQGFALTVTLPAVVGAQRAAELLYTGRRLDAAAALEVGLCDRHAITPDDEAHSLAVEIAASAPLAVAAMRSTLRGPLVTAVDSALAAERVDQERLMETTDFREGIRASRDRREPVFSGR